MKKILLCIATMTVLFSCTKEIDNTQTCGWVFDKFFQNPPGDTTLANRTYFLWLATDTLATGPGSHYVIQVNKPVFDTMLIGQPYSQQYCY